MNYIYKTIYSLGLHIGNHSFLTKTENYKYLIGFRKDISIIDVNTLYYQIKKSVLFLSKIGELNGFLLFYYSNIDRCPFYLKLFLLNIIYYSNNHGYIHNKWGAQIGLRGFDAFGIENLNFLGEFNTVRPYTYSHFDPISNYSHFSQPLAHPIGANFREVLGIFNYSVKRFDMSLQGNYSTYGLDPSDENNFGKNIFKSYNDFENRYGNKVGQGIKTNLGYLDGRIAYLLNPKYNLRLELGGILRRESNEFGRNTSAMMTFGLRSSFRNLYYDF